MKLISIIALITIICLTGLSDTRKKQVKLSQEGSKPKKRKEIRYAHVFSEEKVTETFSQIFQMFATKGKSEINECIEKVFQTKKNTPQARALWNYLTQSVLEYKTPVKLEELRKFADTVVYPECKDTLKNNLMTDAEYDKAGIDLLKSKSVEFLRKIIDELKTVAQSKMKKFITSSVSTYRNDPMVSRRVFSSLNGTGSGEKTRKQDLTKKSAFASHMKSDEAKKTRKRRAANKKRRMNKRK